MHHRETPSMPMTNADDSNRAQPLVLLTGATGYVGGRLLRALQSRGVRLRCLARQPERLQEHVSASTEIVAGDVLDEATLTAAMRGVDAVTTCAGRGRTRGGPRAALACACRVAPDR